MLKLLNVLLLSALVLQLQAADKWLTDLEAAKKQAQKDDKVILLDFTGSDWCPGCIALKKKVFSKKQFREFAEKNLVLVEVDFPRRKKQTEAQIAANEKLSEQFKVEGFPTIVLLDKNGKELGRLDEGYFGEKPAEYIQKLEKIIKPAKS